MGWGFGQTPAHILQKALQGLALMADPSNPKHAEGIGIVQRKFVRMTDILYQKKEGDEASARSLQLVTEISHSTFLLDGLNQMVNFPVEQRKQFTIIFTGCLACQIGTEYPIEVWILRNQHVFNILLNFYEHPELAVHAGEMLRLCAHHAPLAKALLMPERLDRLFPFFSVPHFDVAADSFATFRELILKSPIGVKEFIPNNIPQIIQRLHATLDENNYAACRQSLKLIYEIIDEIECFKRAYLGNEQNLIVMMKLMSSQYKNISIEAFNIFKLFVKCQDKTQSVKKILTANSDKLIAFINTLLDGNEDLQPEKDYLIVQLGVLREGQSTS